MKRRGRCSWTAWFLLVLAGPCLAGEDLLRNGSFELPAGAGNAIPLEWKSLPLDTKTIGTARETGRTGAQSLRFKAQEVANAYQALVQEVTISDKERYGLSVHVRNSKEDPLKGEISGQVVIEWRNKDGREVGRQWTVKWDQSLSRAAWRKYALPSLKPPHGAVAALIGIHVFEGAHGGQGSFFVDDLELTVK